MTTRVLTRAEYRRKRRERRHRYADKEIGRALAWWYVFGRPAAIGLGLVAAGVGAWQVWARVDHAFIALMTGSAAVILAAAFLLDPRRRLGWPVAVAAVALVVATVVALMYPNTYV
jgi:hypothetical protein